MPIGGHKGYGLALVMEMLAGVLTDAGFGSDHRASACDGREEPDLGHFFMAIDPELFMPASEFTARVDRMIDEAKAGQRAHGVEEILMPGEKEMRARARSLLEGVPLTRSTLRTLQTYRTAARLDAELALVEIKRCSRNGGARELERWRLIQVLDLRSAVGSNRGNHVADPAEQPAAADPQTGRDDQPEDAAEEIGVVELADSRNDRAQDRCDSRVLHERDRMPGRYFLRRIYVTWVTPVILPSLSMRMYSLLIVLLSSDNVLITTW